MTDADTHLRAIRRYEFERVREWFRPGMRVLELGGGSGYQASLIAGTGAEVRSLDIPGREGGGDPYWDVEDYDGLHVDAPDGSFDVVFTSNVLEHISKLDETMAELRRVLRPGGVAIHVLPSASWRLWMNLAQPIAVARSLVRSMAAAPASPATVPSERSTRRAAGPRLLNALRSAFIAEPHGEYPSALSELWYFSRFRWRAYFGSRGWRVQSSFGNRLFYTGWVLVPGLPWTLRRAAALLFGSSTRTFILVPADDTALASGISAIAHRASER